MTIRGFFIAFLMLISLAACSNNPVATASVPDSATPSPSPSSSPTLSATVDPFELTKEANQTRVVVFEVTRHAKKTQYALTPSTTPLPSNTPGPTHTPFPTRTLENTPLPTPTFNSLINVTFTPFPPAQCPIPDPDLQPPDFESLGQNINLNYFLNYFDSGGTLQNLPVKWKPPYQIDLTNDGIQEFILEGYSLFGGFAILGCVDEHYRMWLDELKITDQLNSAMVLAIKDVNNNGYPELILRTTESKMSITGYRLYEWDGHGFQNLIDYPDDLEIFSEILPFAPFKNLDFIDVDKNGTLEIIFYWDVPLWTNYLNGFPLRAETHTYIWNGQKYFLYKVELAAPEYRFQAVQDGDRASLRGEYHTALDFYQQAIFRDDLEWWTLARKEYLQESHIASILLPTPVGLAPDPNEDDNLEAYARYRIMLLYVIQNQMVEANIFYTTLQEKFLAGQPGYLYAEMASAFWSEYQSSSNIERACLETIQYAETHMQEIFTYLGNSDLEWYLFGGQSLYYEPPDVCPFNQGVTR
jgi:hypothetical protein